MYNKMKDQDDIWKAKVYKSFHIKMGFEHIRKENLLRIDHLLRPLHKEALSELLSGKWRQKIWFFIWFLIFLFMALILFPVLLILNEEGLDIPIPVIFLPFTLCWFALIIVSLSFFYIAYKTKQKVLTKI